LVAAKDLKTRFIRPPLLYPSKIPVGGELLAAISRSRRWLTSRAHRCIGTGANIRTNRIATPVFGAGDASTPCDNALRHNSACGHSRIEPETDDSVSITFRSSPSQIESAFQAPARDHELSKTWPDPADSVPKAARLSGRHLKD
jgi:hypothetical protein